MRHNKYDCIFFGIYYMVVIILFIDDDDDYEDYRQNIQNYYQNNR